MNYGAGIIAAEAFGAVPIDPRPFASGTIKKIFEKYPGLGPLLPAMGYSGSQKKELEEAINSTPADLGAYRDPCRPLPRISTQQANCARKLRDRGDGEPWAQGPHRAIRQGPEMKGPLAFLAKRYIAGPERCRRHTRGPRAQQKRHRRDNRQPRRKRHQPGGSSRVRKRVPRPPRRHKVKQGPTRPYQ